MTSEQAKDEPTPAEPAPSEELPPPPPDEEPTESIPEEKRPAEDVWKEDYDDLVEPEEEPRPRKKKSKHWGAIIVTAALIIILVGWTVASPRIMDQVGQTYTRSPTYASWGNYTGHLDLWAGNTTWGVSLSGHATSADNRSVQIDVLVTKVQEKPGNWFFRGTAITLRNVSVFAADGTWLASMSNVTDLGFGVSASVPVTFSSAGTYDLYITAKFLMYEVMRIGFYPVRIVSVPPVYVEFSIVVT